MSKPLADSPIARWDRADLRALAATLLAIYGQAVPDAKSAAAGVSLDGRAIAARNRTNLRAFQLRNESVECDLLIEFDGGEDDLARIVDGAGGNPIRVVARVNGIFAVRAQAAYLVQQLVSQLEGGGPPAPSEAASDSLLGLVAAGAVKRLSLSRAVRVSSGFVGVAQRQLRSVREAARVAPGDDGLDGRGVRLCLVDTMFDFAHAAALPRGAAVEMGDGPNPDLRIDGLFDPFTSSSRAAAVVGTGSTFGRQALLDDIKVCWSGQDDGSDLMRTLRIGQRDARAAGERDTARVQTFEHHGTYALGIAAGSGNGSAGHRFAGVAPAADLALAVAGIQDEAPFADSLDIIASVGEMLERFGRSADAAPIVLMVNNGDCLGAHDGSLLGERMVDEALLRPGRAVVLPAGNQNLSATGVAGAGTPVVVPHVCLPAPSSDPRRSVMLGFRYFLPGDKADAIEIWFRAGEGRVPAARITFRDAAAPTFQFEGGVPRSFQKTTLRSENGREVTYIAELGPASAEGLWRLKLHLLPVLVEGDERGYLPDDPIRFEIDGVVGDLHAWCDWNNESRRNWVEPKAGRQDDRTTLTTPATARRGIVVGQCVEMPDGGFKAAEDSGRGPTLDGRHKPDVVAVGASLAVPARLAGASAHRLLERRRSAGEITQAEYEAALYMRTVAGTSFAVPQVAGLAALLFQKWPHATWADIRQAIVEAAVRPEDWAASAPIAGRVLPIDRPPATPRGDDEEPPEPGLRAFAWDRALGYGRIDVGRTLAPPPPRVDLWLRKAHEDDGREPFVAETLWAGPGIAVAGPNRVDVELGERGREAAQGLARLYLFHAPLGATHPLPRLDGTAAAGGLWAPLLVDADGKPGFVPASPGGRLGVPTRDDVDLHDGNPRLIAAVVDHDQDRYVPEATLGMRNNIAVLSAASATIRNGELTPVPEFTVIGSDDVDSAMVWVENLSGTLRIDDIPVTALPWRKARLFIEDGRLRAWRRPYLGHSGDAEHDPANRLARETDVPQEKRGITDAIRALTDVEWASGLKLRRPDDDPLLRVSLSSTEGRLWLPRLRIAQGHPLRGLKVRLEGPASLRGETGEGRVHLVHFSGGRRVGGGSVRVAVG